MDEQPRNGKRAVRPVDWVITESKLRGVAFRCLLTVAWHADWGNGGGSWPSISRIAKLARCSRRAAFLGIKQAVEAGELERAGWGPDGSTCYRLPLFDPQMSLPGATIAPPPAQVVQKLHSGGEEVAPNPSLNLQGKRPARSCSSADIYEGARPGRERRACPVPLTEGFRKKLQDTAARKDLANARPGPADLRRESLSAGIFRKRISAAFFDCCRARMDAGATVRELLHEIALDLGSNRAVETRWLDLDRAERAAAARLHPRTSALFAVRAYERREQLVVDAAIAAMLNSVLGAEGAAHVPKTPATAPQAAERIRAPAPSVARSADT
jgi:Helix-turn-helix domain